MSALAAQMTHHDGTLAPVREQRPATSPSATAWRELEHARVTLQQVLHLLGDGPTGGGSVTPAQAALYLAGQAVRSLGIAMHREPGQAAAGVVQEAVDSTVRGLDVLQAASRAGSDAGAARDHFRQGLQLAIVAQQRVGN